MLHIVKKYAKMLCSDIHAAVIALVVAGVFLPLGGIYFFFKDLWTQIIRAMLMPTALWATTLLFFLLAGTIVYVWRRTPMPKSTPDPEFTERFHVLWDQNHRMRCMNCGKPLKASSDDDPSKFFCVNPRCNVKHILKDEHGTKLTEAGAIALIGAILPEHAQHEQRVGFPLPEWFTGEDLMRTYGISTDQLKQYVMSGLNVYPAGDDVLYLGDDVPPLDEQDLSFEIDDHNYSKYRFKKDDVEQFIKGRL